MTRNTPISAGNDGEKIPPARKTLSGIIDVHSHAILNIGKQAPIATQPEWSVEKTLSIMDRHNIAACILSVPDAANHVLGQEARDIARRINDILAGIVQKHPTRFGAMATLPGRNPDGALAEMEYALDTLKMDGVATSTNIDDVYLGEPEFDPWFAEMNRRATTLFIHPAASRASRTVDLGINVSILEFMFDTTRMLTNMVLNGAKKRFSDIKMISTHGGGTLPFLTTRVEILATHFGAGRERAKFTVEEIREGYASFYYDLTGATSAAQIHALLQLVPASKLLVGFDVPFMPTQSIAPAIADIEGHAGFSNDDLRMLAYGNAELLYPSLQRRLAVVQSA